MSAAFWRASATVVELQAGRYRTLTDFASPFTAAAFVVGGERLNLTLAFAIKTPPTRRCAVLVRCANV